MNQTEYKPFHDILFDINISMKQIINPLIKHQQAIEYTIINMNKKLYFMEKDFEKMEKMKIETFSEKVKKEDLESIWFDVREPVELFTGRTKELDELHKLVQRKRELTVISQTTSISGLGGIGKSELARKYVHEHSQDYDSNVIWINAESYVTLVESFHRLAQDELGICTRNIDGKEKDIKSIVRDVYKYFAKKKSLFIFDNAEKYRTQRKEDEGVDKFLPSSSLPPNANKPYFIITSRNQKWGNIDVLQLDTFTEEEAIEFIKKTLDIKDNLQNEEIKQLAEKLQCFPLALQQAVAYIRERDRELKNIRKEFNINDYLNKYREKTKELLDFEFPGDSNDSYTKTTFVTWDITLDVIKQNKHGNLALKILNTMAYFAPDNIPAKVFLGFVEGDSEDLGSMIQLLKQYSMVSSIKEQAILNIHRLVQQVTSLKLKDQSNEEETLRETLELVNKKMDKESLDHAASAWNYASKYDELVKEFSELPSHIILELNNSVRYEEAYLFGVKELELLVCVLGPDHPSTLATIHNIASVLAKQGQYEEALKLYQEVLDKQKQILGSDHPNTLSTMHNIAFVLDSQGKYEEALKLYQKVLDKEKQILGSDHPSK